MITESSIKKQLEISNLLGTLDISFLKKEGVTLEHFVLLFLSTGNVFDINSGKKIFSFEGCDALKNIVNSSNMEINEAIEISGYLSMLKIDTCGFSIYHNEDKLELYYNKLLVCTFEKETFTSFVFSFVNNIVAKNISSKEFYAKDLIYSGSGATYTKSSKILFENSTCGFITENESKMMYEEINERMNRLVATQKEVLKMIEEDISPIMYLKREKKYDLELDTSEDAPTMYLDASGRFEVITIDGRDTSFAVSEPVVFDTSYFTYKSIDCYVDNAKDKYRVPGVDGGDIDFYFDGDVILYDEVNDKKYYLKFNPSDSINKYKIKTILLDKENKYLQIEFSADVYQFTVGKYDKKLSDVEKTNLINDNFVDVINENRSKSIFFKNNSIKVAFVNPSMPRKPSISYNIITKFYKKYETIKKYFINKDITIDLAPSFYLSEEKFSGYKTQFLKDGDTDISFSKEVGFGFLTEPEIETGVRQDGNFDFSRGLKDVETDTELPIKEFNGKMIFILNSLPNIDDEIIVMKLKNTFEDDYYIVRAKKTEAAVISIVISKEGDAVDYTGSTPGQPVCRIKDLGNIEIGFSVKNNQGECSSEDGDFYIKNIISGDFVLFIKTVLQKCSVLSNDFKYFKSIFLSGIRISKFLIERQLSFSSNVVTDRKTYYMAQNLVFMPKEIIDASITLNGIDSTTMDYVNSVNILDPIKKADTKIIGIEKQVFYGAESIISFSNVFDILQNPEVQGFELYIYDGLDYNSCCDIGSGAGKKAYKTSLTPIGLIYKRNVSGIFEADISNTNHNISSKYFNLDKIELKYPMSFEIFNEKSRNITVVFIVNRFGIDAENLRYNKIISTTPAKLELDIKYDEEIIDNVLTEHETSIASGVIIPEEGKNYFYSRIIKKIKITTNFDLRIYKEIDVFLDLYGDDPGIWMTKLDYNTGEFPTGETMVVTAGKKIDAKQLKIKLVFEYDQDGVRKIVPKLEYDNDIMQVVKLNDVEKVFYTSNLQDTSYVEIKFAIISKTFNRNISVDINKENIYEILPKNEIKDYLKLNITGEFDLSQLNQFYQKVNTKDFPDAPVLYILSSLNSYNSASILNYITNIKFQAQASNMASQYIKFVVCGLRLSSGKIVPNKYGSASNEFNILSTKQEGIVTEDGEDYIQWNYTVSFATPSNEPIRALLIMPYIVWDKIPDENPRIRIKLGDQNNDMVQIKESMVAKNYSQLCRTTPFYREMFLKCYPALSGMCSDLVMQRYAMNQISVVGKMWMNIKFGEERINTIQDTMYYDRDLTLTANMVDYFNLDSYGKSADVIPVDEGGDINQTQYLHGFDFTSLKSKSYLTEIYDVNIGIKKQDYTNYKVTPSQTLVPNMSKIVTDVVDVLSDRITINNISDGQAVRNSATGNFFSKSLAVLLWDENVRNEMFIEAKNNLGYVKKDVEINRTVSDKNPRMFKVGKIGFKKTSASTDMVDNIDFVYTINKQEDIDAKNDIFIKLTGDGVSSSDVKKLLLKMKQINIPKDFYVTFRISYQFFKDGDTNYYDINLTDKFSKDYIVGLSEPSSLSMPFKIPAVFSMKEMFEQIGDIKLFVDDVVQINCVLIISTGEEDITETEKVTPMTLNRTSASIDEINNVTAI